jgi:hypothetical protein
MRRTDCHNRLKQVRMSYETARQTVEVFRRIAQQQPQYLYDYKLTLADIDALAIELHDIYFTRLFACFESILRQYWRAKVRNSRPSTEQLLSSVAGRFVVSQDTLDAVSEIRAFRNLLIHEEHDVKRRFTIDEASGHLNTFLARLPLHW